MKIKTITYLTFLLLFKFSFLLSQGINNCNVLETFPTPYGAVGDITYSDDSIYLVSQNTDNIIISKISPEDGTVINEFLMNSNISFNTIAYGDDNLWLVESDDRDNHNILKVNPSTGNIISSFPFNLVEDDIPHGLYFIENKLYLVVVNINNKDKIISL